MVVIQVVAALPMIGEIKMKKYLAMLVVLATTLFAVNSFAWDPPASPAPTSWISDSSSVLSADAHARLDLKLKQINQSSANELAALVIPTLDGQSIEDVTNATFKAWGVGKKNLDNGVVVVLAMKEHKSRIETGKGVEGDLPDLKANDILQAARPYLRKGDVEGALGFIFDSSVTLIANHKADLAAGRTSSADRQPSCQVSAPGNSGDSIVPWALTLLVAGLGLWYVIYRAKRRSEQEALNVLQRWQNANGERARLLKLEETRSQYVGTISPAPIVQPESVVSPRPIARDIAPAIAIAAASTIAIAEEEHRRHREQSHKQREVEEQRANAARKSREEDDRRRRDSESSSSSSSSSDWSSGGSSGGFGGGDSGGGGSSGDW